MPGWLIAGWWGLVAGSALLVGAAVGWWVRVPRPLITGVMAFGGGVLISALSFAVFVSNVPEGLSSVAGMRAAGRGGAYVAGVWGGITALSGLAALAGYAVFAGLSPAVIAAVTALAAGAMLAMIADTMIPEAFAEAHGAVGLVTVAGFLAAFELSKLGG